MERGAPPPDGERRALAIAGIARRAGRAAVGTRSVQAAARGGDLAAVLIAVDASENARARVQALLEVRDVPLVRCATRAALGTAVGRGPTAVIGIMDRRLAAEALASLRAARPAP